MLTDFLSDPSGWAELVKLGLMEAIGVIRLSGVAVGTLDPSLLSDTTAAAAAFISFPAACLTSLRDAADKKKSLTGGCGRAGSENETPAQEAPVAAAT